jgi:putative transcriptional regulator
MPRKKRTLIDELMDGVAAMAAHREGKLTLRTHRLDVRPLPRVTAALVRNTREQLNMSQRVFARKLRVNPRTLERWEQGRSRPNDQAAALILLVRRFPDTVDRLDVIGTSRRSRRAA